VFCIHGSSIDFHPVDPADAMSLSKGDHRISPRWPSRFALLITAAAGPPKGDPREPFARR